MMHRYRRPYCYVDDDRTRRRSCYRCCGDGHILISKLVVILATVALLSRAWTCSAWCGNGNCGVSSGPTRSARSSRREALSAASLRCRKAATRVPARVAQGLHPGRGLQPEASRKLDSRPPENGLEVSIESIAAALEGGKPPDASPVPQRREKRQRQMQSHPTNPPPDGSRKAAASRAQGKASVSSSEGGAVNGEGSGTPDGDERLRMKKPNAISSKERRSKKKEDPETRRLQDDVARQLKAGSPSGTLAKFNEAMKAGIVLRSNLLCGVLNQCAKAGWMDDCMRVLYEMKARGMVIEENTFVPLIRGLVSRGHCAGALELIKDMVSQGVQPRLRCYEPVIAGMCATGDMDGARAVWAHMEEQEVLPREQQYVDFLVGLGIAGELWENARSGKLDELLVGMSYHARNLTMDQIVELETSFNTVVTSAGSRISEEQAGLDESNVATKGRGGKVPAVMHEAAADEGAAPLARRVKVEGSWSISDEDDDTWRTPWSDAAHSQAQTFCCPACGGELKAVGLTPDERARIRSTLFGLAGLQVKKHSRNRWTRMAQKNKKFDAMESSYFSFTDEDQREQLQIFVDWLHAQRATGKTYTAVIDSANVAYHKGNPWHFSLPQVDLMVQALEARGERPLVVIAEKYIDRVGDTGEGDTATAQPGKFKYMSSALNKAIVKRWRAKSQVYECSDEASDDWYWLYAAVAFDDIPMTVISNDRTRDHRMSLAEPVPFLRWRTTQLAKFELSWGLKNLMSRHGADEEGVNAQGWPKKPPTIAIQPPPPFTRDIQKSDQGCWHIPAGAGNDWLCVDVPRGLRMRLDVSSAKRGGGAPAGLSNEGKASPVGDVVNVGEEFDQDKIRKVGGLLQTMRVKKATSRGLRYSTQGTVEAAAKQAAAAAAEKSLRGAAAAASQRDSVVIEADASGVSASSLKEEEGLKDDILEVTRPDWSSMTVLALKDELRTRGLKVSGRKAELVERLHQSA